MSNKITLDQPACKGPIFGDLSAGEMFRLPGGGDTANVYMKAFTSGYITNAVYLRTGALYDMAHDRPIIPVVGAVTITPDAC